MHFLSYVYFLKHFSTFMVIFYCNFKNLNGKRNKQMWNTEMFEIQEHI